MPTKNVRLNQETQGTVAGEGHRRMVMLPEGCEIALVGQVAGHPEMVEVSWNGNGYGYSQSTSRHVLNSRPLVAMKYRPC